ncbi:hypothetical protein [Rothia nasimurium]|uniref:hypothetical protein n=1 Tax=Rothia nasimurium TaxID=85336 RepID=UPI001F319921|nr:hypothetical protein [Rothia nasimurium]
MASPNWDLVAVVATVTLATTLMLDERLTKLLLTNKKEKDSINSEAESILAGEQSNFLVKHISIDYIVCYISIVALVAGISAAIIEPNNPGILYIITSIGLTIFLISRLFSITNSAFTYYINKEINDHAIEGADSKISYLFTNWRYFLCILYFIIFPVLIFPAFEGATSGWKFINYFICLSIGLFVLLINTAWMNSVMKEPAGTTGDGRAENRIMPTGGEARVIVNFSMITFTFASFYLGHYFSNGKATLSDNLWVMLLISLYCFCVWLVQGHIVAVDMARRFDSILAKLFTLFKEVALSFRNKKMRGSDNFNQSIVQYLENSCIDKNIISLVESLIKKGNQKLFIEQQEKTKSMFTIKMNSSKQIRVGLVTVNKRDKKVRFKVGGNYVKQNEKLSEWLTMKDFQIDETINIGIRGSHEFKFFYKTDYVDNSGLQREPFLLDLFPRISADLANDKYRDELAGRIYEFLEEIYKVKKSGPKG